jgi:hypothetical protein
VRPDRLSHTPTMGIREPRSVDQPSRRFPSAIQAPKRQAASFDLKDEIVPADRTQPVPDESEHTSRPCEHLGGAEPGMVQADVMWKVLDEHGQPTLYVVTRLPRSRLHQGMSCAHCASDVPCDTKAGLVAQLGIPSLQPCP